MSEATPTCKIALVVTAFLGLCAPVAAHAQTTLLTTNGFAIETQPANGLTCAQISEQLSAIDETGYRIGGPAPTNDADGAVYDYELKLSVEYFWRCATRVDGAAQNDAFRSGFTEQKN